MQLFFYVAGKKLKEFNLEHSDYNQHPMTVTDDGVLITGGWCKPHQSRSSHTDSQRTNSDNRNSTEDSRSINNDTVDHSDDGTEEMSESSDSEEYVKKEQCLVYYKLNY